MTLGQRVAVLDHGVVQQVHTPSVLYDRPANLLRGVVHREPGNDFLRVHTDGTSIAFATHRLPLPETVAGSLTRKEGEMILGFRPEHFSVTSSPRTARRSRRPSSTPSSSGRRRSWTSASKMWLPRPSALIRRRSSPARSSRASTPESGPARASSSSSRSTSRFFDPEDDRSL